MEELLSTKKKKMRREGALLSGAFKLTHPALAKLWEDKKAKSTAEGSSEGKKHSLSAPTANRESIKSSLSSVMSNPSALPRIDHGHYPRSGAKGSLESASSLGSNMTRVSCLEPPQQHLGATPQPVRAAPRPLGVPRFQQSFGDRAPVPLQEESVVDFCLPLPELPPEEVRKEGERRGRKISTMAAPPIGADEKLPSISPPDVTMAIVEKEAGPARPPPPSEVDDDEGGSTDTLDLYLEELAKSPHFEEYLRLLQTEEVYGRELTRAFTFSYFNLC